jgi:serine/threonine protein kinase
MYLKLVSNHFLEEFFGANILDEKPFIVMPYLVNGNARDYLLEHPNEDRLQIVSLSNVCILFLLVFTLHVQLHDISLGLVYLHSHKIVHGDLKAVRCLHVLTYICTTKGKL